MNRTIGVVLIVLGLVGLAWGGFTYTTREKVVDMNIEPLHATRDQTHMLSLPPIVGTVAHTGGIAPLVAGRKHGPSLGGSVGL